MKDYSACLSCVNASLQITEVPLNSNLKKTATHSFIATHRIALKYEHFT